MRINSPQTLLPLLLLALTMSLGRARLAAAESPRNDAVERDTKALQGTWEAVATEEGGENIVKPAGVRSTIQIDGDHYSVLYPGSQSRAAKVGGTTFKVDPSSDSKTIDFTPANNAEGGKDESRPSRGIYKLENDSLRICFNPERGGERPTTFATKAGSRMRCITLKRKAPSTAPAK